MRPVWRRQHVLPAGLRRVQTQPVQDRLPQDRGDPGGSHQDQRHGNGEEQKLPRWEKSSRHIKTQCLYSSFTTQKLIKSEVLRTGLFGILVCLWDDSFGSVSVLKAAVCRI